MEVLNLLFIFGSYVFVAYILSSIVQIIINVSEEKENPEKARYLYLIIFFVILLFIVTKFINDEKQYSKSVIAEKEKYTQDLIEDAESLKELKRAWKNRDW